MSTLKSVLLLLVELPLVEHRNEPTVLPPFPPEVVFEGLAFVEAGDRPFSDGLLGQLGELLF